MPSGSQASLGFFGGLSGGLAEGFRSMLPLLIQKNKQAQERALQDRVFKFKVDSQKHEQMLEAFGLAYERYDSDFLKLPKDAQMNVSPESAEKLEQNLGETLMRVVNHYGREAAGPYVQDFANLVKKQEEDDRAGVGAGLGDKPGPTKPRGVPTVPTEESKPPYHSRTKPREDYFDITDVVSKGIPRAFEGLTQNFSGMIQPNVPREAAPPDRGVTLFTEKITNRVRKALVKSLKISSASENADTQFYTPPEVEQGRLETNANAIIEEINGSLVMMDPEGKDRFFSALADALEEGRDMQDAFRIARMISRNALGSGLGSQDKAQSFGSGVADSVGKSIGR